MADHLDKRPPGTHATLRKGLPHCRRRFARRKTGRVAFIGGSITQMRGWRERTYKILRNMFPQTRFEFINAGVGGTNSTLGAMRLEADAFKHGPVDLLFLEFAVNDGGGSDRTNTRAMEGIIRHARRLNPEIDILMLYFADQGKIKVLNAGEQPATVACHERVARHYGIPVIDLARVVRDRLSARAFRWEQFSRDGCHPLPFGHALYAECIEAFLRAAWATPTRRAKVMPLPRPLDPLNYQRGRFIDPRQAETTKGWTFIRKWDHDETKCNYSGAVNVLAATTPGAALTLAFRGTAIGVYAIVGMDAGTLEYRIDGGRFRKANLFDHYCTEFHRPQHRLFADALSDGDHCLELRMAKTTHRKSRGHAARIMEFIVN